MGFILFYSRNDFILISRQQKMKKKLKKDEGIYAFLPKTLRFASLHPTTIIFSEKNRTKTAQQKSISLRASRLCMRNAFRS